MSKLQHLKTLIKRLLIIYFLYFICRVAFLAFYYHLILPHSGKVWFAFIYGLRFDTVAIFYTNSLLILLSLLPWQYRERLWYQVMLRRLFVACNSIFIILNVLDLGYYRFEKHRSAGDIFQVATGGGNLMQVMPHYIASFWYLFLIYFSLIALLMFLDRKWNPVTRIQLESTTPTFQYLQLHGLILLIVIPVWIIGARGGLQLKPLTMLNAAAEVPSEQASLVTNTVFTVLTTLDAKPLRPIHFMDDTKAMAMINPIKQYGNDSIPMRKDNVVIIILESFGTEYIGSLSGLKSYTPFLDSLIVQSLSFEYSFANGMSSIQAPPSVLASLPSLTERSFITSAYVSNHFNTLPSILKQEGYETAFFHGGVNGTMGFDLFSKAAGIDHYYGKNEYPDQQDFDGEWGIFDEPYEQYMANTLSTYNKPFMACLFTVSSHHPYKIPPQYKGRFPKGTLPIHECVGYSDYALRQFFATASKMPWFKNTLFVLTGDHTSIPGTEAYGNRLGRIRIPVVFYRADGSLKGHQDKLAQQIDIMPSVLDNLHYIKPFFAYGHSVFDTVTDRKAMFFLWDYYQTIGDSLMLITYGSKLNELFNYRTDPALKHNLAAQMPDTINNWIEYTNAYRQVYNNSLVEDRMKVSP